MPKVILANPLSGKEIDHIAEKIIRSFQPSALLKPEPFDIERFFECALEKYTRVVPDYDELKPGIHGYTDISTMRCVISNSLVEDESNIKFLRSTQAHETGHCVIHVKQFRIKKAVLKFIHDDNEKATLKLYREEEIPTFRNPEWQAWRFAGAILMPRSSVLEAIKRGYNEFELAVIYNVNPAFVGSRLKALKIQAFH